MPRAAFDTPTKHKREMEGLMDDFVPLGLGWHPDVPDFRDFTVESGAVKALLDRLPVQPAPPTDRQRVDLREFFPAVRDQMHLNASPAHACLGLVQYFDRRAHGQISHPSHLFLYAMTRKLLRATGNAGVNLRSSFKALAAFGVPPEQFWPYDTDLLDEEPDGFLYSFPNPCQGLVYLRLDGPNNEGGEVLQRLKAFLHAGFPVAFGFAVPMSLSAAGDIPYRPRFDAIQGGQAAVAVGYDDERLQTTRGAILLRNSWGPQWGEQGYGWLPYTYVEQRMALDFWTILRADWLESGEFFRPREGD